MNEHIYILQIIARNYDVANQLAVAISGNEADELTFTEDYALPMTRDGQPALAIEVPCKVAQYNAASSFRDGGNPFGLPPATNAAYRATMEVRTGTRDIHGTLRQWAHSIGYEVNV